MAVFFAKTITGLRYYIHDLYIHVTIGRCGKRVYDFGTIMASSFKLCEVVLDQKLDLDPINGSPDSVTFTIIQ